MFLFDKFGRKITYLRISITDRCNLHCSYCKTFPYAYIPKKQILKFEEIEEVVKISSRLGINKIRLTGGEPLLRTDIVKLIRMIKSTRGINDLGLTTNGILLASMAHELYKAGLIRINVSLDTLDPREFRLLTGKTNLHTILKGILLCKKLGFNPIKINSVLWNNDEKKKQSLIDFCERNGLELRFIRMMDLEKGIFSVVEGSEVGNCNVCNRIRLISDGHVKPCLFSDIGFSIREFGVEKAIQLAVENKPEKGMFSKTHKFYNIGG